jgi:hypothetical protein
MKLTIPTENGWNIVQAAHLRPLELVWRKMKGGFDREPVPARV